ncbi:MAG: ATP-binding protein [Gemmatimonadetes bacterium]|nr:ATP-binding protein [Gemmatimonadota bacterium]
MNIAYLSGELGIGKTSLLAFLRHFLQKQFGVLGVHVFLAGADTLEEALHRIFDQILRVARHEHVAGGGPELFRSSQATAALGTDGLTLRAPDRELLAIGENLDTVVHSLLARMAPRYHGMMLILDNINEVATSNAFAHWLKSFVDAASTRGKEPPLFLLLAGQEESRQALMSANPSLDRLLQAETLGPWSEGDATEFFQHAFSSAERPVTPDAVRAMANFCNGRPAVAHKLGDATWRGDRDAHVTEDDAMTGLFELEPRVAPPEPALPGQREKEDAAQLSRRTAPSKIPNRQLLSVLRSLI